MNPKKLEKILLATFFLAVALWTGGSIVRAEPVTDPRCCVRDIPRDKDGKILRSKQVIKDFQKLYPCPSTGKTYGACPGWARDHVVPLAVGGVDAVYNLQWLPNTIKSCSGETCKDRWEQKVYRSR